MGDEIGKLIAAAIPYKDFKHKIRLVIEYKRIGCKVEVFNDFVIVEVLNGRTSCKKRY